jgi:hypothetical protein
MAPSPPSQNVNAGPECVDSAWNSGAGVDVYLKREDLDRALALELQSAQVQMNCAGAFGNNISGQYSMLRSAADNYAHAADLAFQLRQYSVVRSSIKLSDKLYRQMLSILGQQAFLGDLYRGDQQNIMANLTANADLLARVPK